ncbi:MAG: hypothetical protein AAFO79_06820, partial [Pseudomonadota bacterium]
MDPDAPVCQAAAAHSRKRSKRRAIPVDPVAGSVPVAVSLTGAKATSGSRWRRLFGDKLADTFHDGPDRFELFDFFVGVVWNLDAEPVFNVEHDHRQIERFDLER